MSDEPNDLGRIVAIHGISPAYLQRAVFVIVLSFLFFLAMMFAFYLLQNVIYFLLASAFLLVYLVTLFSWLMQKKKVVKIFENGIEYRKLSCGWDEIDSATINRSEPTAKLVIKTKAGGLVEISDTIAGFDQIAKYISSKIPNRPR